MRIKYKPAVISVSTALLLLAILLSLLLYVRGPRVRLVNFSTDPSSTSLHKNSTVTITFDRPIEEGDYSEKINFEPAVDFSAKTFKQSMVVTFNENLRHNTDYSLVIQPGIYDLTGRSMKPEYKHSFKTSDPRYAYLDRNYEGANTDDHVKLAKLGEDEEILFSAPVISQFAINKDYLAVVEAGEKEDQLFTLDLNSGVLREETLPLGGRIKDLVVSPVGQTALFSVSPPYDSTDSEYYESVVGKVEALNMQDGSVSSILDAKGDYVRTFSAIRFDSLGRTALIQDRLQTFYAISPFNDYEPILIGSYSTSFGFDDKTAEIVFRSSEDFVRYDVEASETQLHEFISSGYIQNVSNTHQGVFYSTIEYFSGEPRSKVYKINDWQDTRPSLLWSNTEDATSLLASVDISNDGAILALQINPTNCSYDAVKANNRCKSAKTVLYNHQTLQELTVLDGFDVVWLP